MELGFRSNQRIKRSSEFLRIKTHGKRRIKGCLVANWMKTDEGAKSRLGVITSRRVGGAVTRNRARRLMREAFRLNQHRFTYSIDLILVARRSICGMKRQDVERDFLRIMKSSGLIT
ncbi:MAG TPA: ribonuclease P protein component [Verrucomicrobiales bacterium]|nr:ribonuclease P protein component [Verrucomicrobiales bacterium]